MRSAFLLQHSYNWKHQGEIIEETKIIGIFSSRQKEEQIMEKLKLLPGFKEHPIDCFYLHEYTLDQEHWKEGFI